MRVFELVKENVTVPQAAQRYGVEIRHGKARCPFHDDHTPSLLVKDNHYHCFGCGAHGDVIDFVAELFHISPCEAAERLMMEFGLDPRDPPPASSSLRLKLRRSEEQQRREHEDRCFADLHDYLWLLRDWKERLAPTSLDDMLDGCFVEACHQLPRMEFLLDEWLAGGELEQNEIIRSGEVSRIRTRLGEIRKEVQHRERDTLLAG